MNFRETNLEGTFVIEPDRIEDERGYFARTWCWEEFHEHGLDTAFVQCNTSFNRLKGTLRGLHFQTEPFGEDKLIRCTRGRVFDVAVDLRPHSSTNGQWISVELTAESTRMIYLPKGLAHGFQTLEDDTELFYQMSAPYNPGAADGVRWDDPDLAIAWPLPDEAIVSDRDRSLALMSEAQCS